MIFIHCRRLKWLRGYHKLILMYHKVDIIASSRWWVTVDIFEKQISLLRKNYKFVNLDQYEQGNDSQVVLTFDDAYENIFNHAFPIMENYGIPFEVFINGDLIGDWNDFENEELLTRFCSIDHLKKMAGSGGRMQWHSRNHKYLPGLSEDELVSELDINNELRAMFPSPHFQWFAYPFGMHDERTMEMVRTLFSGALSVSEGSDTDRYQLNRVVVDNAWMPPNVY